MEHTKPVLVLDFVTIVNDNKLKNEKEKLFLLSGSEDSLIKVWPIETSERSEENKKKRKNAEEELDSKDKLEFYTLETESQAVIRGLGASSDGFSTHVLAITSDKMFHKIPLKQEKPAIFPLILDLFLIVALFYSDLVTDILVGIQEIQSQLNFGIAIIVLILFEVSIDCLQKLLEENWSFMERLFIIFKHFTFTNILFESYKSFSNPTYFKERLKISQELQNFHFNTMIYESFPEQLILFWIIILSVEEQESFKSVSPLTIISLSSSLVSLAYGYSYGNHFLEEKWDKKDKFVSFLYGILEISLESISYSYFGVMIGFKYFILLIILAGMVNFIAFSHTNYLKPIENKGETTNMREFTENLKLFMNVFGFNFVSEPTMKKSEQTQQIEEDKPKGIMLGYSSIPEEPDNFLTLYATKTHFLLYFIVNTLFTTIIIYITIISTQHFNFTVMIFTIIIPILIVCETVFAYLYSMKD